MNWSVIAWCQCQCPGSAMILCQKFCMLEVAHVAAAARTLQEIHGSKTPQW